MIKIGKNIWQTTNEIEYIEHEVLVDDSVSLTKFTEKYEINSQYYKLCTEGEKKNV